MTGTQQALWRRWARRRDARAFEALVAQTQRFVFDFARRITGHDADAEDLAQEAFLELAEAPADKLAAVGLKAFLGRRVVLGAKMLKRAALTRQRHERAAAVPEGVPAPTPHADVEAALAPLDADDRHAVELRFLHDLSYAEVAHVLGVSEPAARMRVHRALKSLRERLGPRAEASVAALALFAPPPPFLSHTVKAAALVGGTVIVGTALKKTIWIVLLLVVAGSGVYLARSDRAATPRDAEAERTARTMPAPADLPPGQHEAPKEQGTGEATANAPRPQIPEGKGSVAGVVRFADGTPLSGVKVQLWGSPAVVAETDSDGRFHIHGDWVGDRDLVITGDNGYYFPLAHVKMRPDALVAVDVVLDAGHVVEGTVVNAATHNPVADVDVELGRPGAKGAGVPQGSWALGATDAEGRFRFAYVPAGDYALSFDAEGLEPATRELRVGPGAGPVEVLLRPARPLVVRFENLPAAWRGAPVTLSFYGLDEEINVYREGKIDERGELRTYAPPPGRYVVATLNGATPLPRLEERVTIAADGIAEFVLALPPGAGVRGTAPPGRTVLVRPADLRTRADAEGRFAFAYVPDGEQRLWVKLGGAWRLGRVLRVPEGGVVEDLALRFAGVTVRGRLVAEGDTWRKGIELRVAGEADEIAKADVDARGDFAIPAVPPGEYDLVAWTEADPKGEAHRIRVGDADLDVGEITVLPGVAVPVFVTAPTGTRLAGEHYVSAERGGAHQGVQVALDENGRGHVKLKPGRWTFELVLGELRSGRIEIEVAADPAPVQIRLR